MMLFAQNEIVLLHLHIPVVHLQVDFHGRDQQVVDSGDQVIEVIGDITTTLCLLGSCAGQIDNL